MILEKWYLSHQNIVTSPYPAYEEKEELANLTNLTITVVARWFTTQRTNEKAEIKKMWKRKPPSPRKSETLTDTQTRTLNQWYLSHRDINYGPYPSAVDKAELAAETNLSGERVLVWFTQRRKHETQAIKETWNCRKARSSHYQEMAKIKDQSSLLSIQKHVCQVCSKLFNEIDFRKFKDICGHQYCRACGGSKHTNLFIFKNFLDLK